MSLLPDARAAEVSAKLALLRAHLDGQDAGALRLRGADWFAWATAGADALAHGRGGASPAELLVTRDEACILASEGDSERLRRDGLPDGFTFHAVPWAEPELHGPYVLGAAGGLPVLSDRPQNGEGALPAPLRSARFVLGEAEGARYRELGRSAAEAVTEALHGARPDWTGRDLAAAAASALWRRGIEPVLVLAMGDRRLAGLAPTMPTPEPLGRRALLRVGARRHGLIASLARSVAFGPLTADERTAQDELLGVESTGLDAVRPGVALSAVYHALEAGYRHVNRPDAIRARDQGGIAGYLLRELLASPSTATGIETGMAFALDPAFPDVPGAQVEDTFLLGAAGLETLTLDPRWPATTIAGTAGERRRPLVLEVT